MQTRSALQTGMKQHQIADLGILLHSIVASRLVSRCVEGPRTSKQSPTIKFAVKGGLLPLSLL